MNPNTKKQHKSRKDNTSTMDVTNDAKKSNDIIDIDDSPDVATWNREVTRNKYHITKDKIIPEIPPTTTIGLNQENNNGKNHQVDPANQKDVDRIYNSGGKLTDDANLFNNKRKYTRNQKGK
ncbi:MAG: hypothetical protein ACRD6Q_07170 [Nitrososphaeraceae archaeon]